MMLESDRQLVLLGSAVLEDYLLSNDLFWSVGGKAVRGKMDLQLTLGNLLLSRMRLAGAVKAGLTFPELSHAEEAIDQVRQHWKVNWAKKASREWTYRLRQWSQYLSEMQDEKNLPANYAFHVRQRAILAILTDEAVEIPALSIKALNELDVNLKLRTGLGDFVWEPEVRLEFSPDKYWFLYLSKPAR